MIRGGTSRHVSAFTLIEVIAAMAVILLLVGGIYSIASGAISLSRASAEARLADLRLSNLVSLMRRQLEGLPSRASLRPEAGGSWLVIDGPSTLPHWTSGGVGVDATGFGIDDEGHLVMEQWQGERRSGRVVLLPGVEAFRWDYFDPVDGRWTDGKWQPSGRRPSLVAMSLQRDRDPAMQRHVFRVAPMTAVAPGGGGISP